MRHFKECAQCPYIVERFFGCQNCKIAKEKDEKNSRVFQGTDKGNAGRIIPDSKRGAVSSSLEAAQIKEVRK